MQGINSVGLSDSIISGDSLRLRSPTVEVLTLAAPITLGQLPNPLIYNQTAYLQSGHNMRVSFSDAVNLRSSLSGAQKEKDSTANATLWRKSDLLYEELQELKNLISLRDLVRLTSLRGVVSYCSINLPSLRGLVRLPDNIGLVSYCSINLPSLRGGVNQVNNVYSVNQVNLIALDSHCTYCAFIDHRTYCRLVQPFGSMPRDCSSLRSVRFIHVARDGSPSIFACSSSCFLNSSVILIWYWGDLFSFGVDMVITLGYCELHGNDHCSISYQIRQRPTVLATHVERLTKPLVEVTIMAIQQHNQTRLKFTFLIASGTQRLVDIHPVRLITVLADCEGEARLLAGKSNLVFVSRQGVAA
ncbi:hypothetical protein XBKB1_2990002 [Xenorhabdus bovienii str. kraussei Becker Underwood]|uniref:Uncharacterized protein n=2 Tax=Xenorhabdus bovienii TaxID=40576 RepID=A0A077PJH8_XENBV|nr:hypothetical protein XBKB1_2990002 [Xenorhabdus bovienii str. kraussei Becker Underwood]